MTRRWIDPAFFTDEKLAKATLTERHLFVAMIANQDDDGRLLGHPGYLRSIAFPYDNFSNKEMKQMRDHLALVNPNIFLYQNADNEYIQLKRHYRYQHPRYYHPSKFPAPPGWPFHDEHPSQASNHTATPQTPHSNQPVTTPHTEDRVGLGRVGLGKGKDTPLPKGKGARKDLRADPRVTEIFKEMEGFLGYPDKVDKNPIPNYAKEGQFIKKMLGRHFTREEILSCGEAKVQQRRGEFVSMAWVNDDIANFVRGGEPLPTVKPERNKAVKPEKEGGHYGTGYKPPKPEGASKPGRTIDAEREAGATD
ncbi:MAG: hypothetical protein MUO99_04395 [Dehalococcoidales bacterium]|nr:hypothetical protein [Dehalococcoidales bacterium]